MLPDASPFHGLDHPFRLLFGSGEGGGALNAGHSRLQGGIRSLGRAPVPLSGERAGERGGKLLETSASLLVTSALLVVTISY